MLPHHELTIFCLWFKASSLCISYSFLLPSFLSCLQMIYIPQKVDIGTNPEIETKQAEHKLRTNQIYKLSSTCWKNVRNLQELKKIYKSTLYSFHKPSHNWKCHLCQEILVNMPLSWSNCYCRLRELNYVACNHVNHGTVSQKTLTLMATSHCSVITFFWLPKFSSTLATTYTYAHSQSIIKNGF